MSITARQRDLLRFIDWHFRAEGFAPSVREMAAAFGHKSPGAVQGILDRLEERGFIRRLRKRARSVEVIRPISR